MGPSVSTLFSFSSISHAIHLDGNGSDGPLDLDRRLTRLNSDDDFRPFGERLPDFRHFRSDEELVLDARRNRNRRRVERTEDVGPGCAEFLLRGECVEG